MRFESNNDAKSRENKNSENKELLLSLIVVPTGQRRQRNSAPTKEEEYTFLSLGAFAVEELKNHCPNSSLRYRYVRDHKLLPELSQVKRRRIIQDECRSCKR